MKKFECKECYIAPCILDVGEDTNRLPKMCPYGVTGTIWHEVKETVTACNQLPDWCKVGEWCYCGIGRNKYTKIKKVLAESILAGEYDTYTADFINSGKVLPARKRPFNEKEMRGLLGKVIVDGDNALFVSMYYGKEQCITAGCLVDFDRDDLMRCSCDGKPCYVLEHKNENGEWVE